MPTLADRILDTLSVQGVPLDDDDLGRRLGVARQAVNQTCRRLARLGLITREVGLDGKLVNRLDSGTAKTQVVPTPPALTTTGPAPSLLSEDEVKRAVKDHLEALGYIVTVAWGRAPGADIDACHPGRRIIIEAKAAVALAPQQANYFLGALGELLQRMEDPDARYGLALPDNRQYRNLVGRLPELAKQRLGLVIFFVRRDGPELRVEEVD
jgi:hypothetical protein